MNGKGSARKWPSPNFKYGPGIRLEGLRNTKKKVTVTIASPCAEI